MRLVRFDEADDLILSSGGVLLLLFASLSSLQRGRVVEVADGRDCRCPLSGLILPFEKLTVDLSRLRPVGLRPFPRALVRQVDHEVLEPLGGPSRIGQVLYLDGSLERVLICRGRPVLVLRFVLLCRAH